MTWLAYGIYEWRMQAWSETVVAPIRVDLLLIAPILYVVSGLGVLGWLGVWRQKQSSIRE